MSVQTWMLFAAAYLATTLSPGPNVLLVIRNTVRYGSHGTAATIAGNLVAQGAVSGWSRSASARCWPRCRRCSSR